MNRYDSNQSNCTLRRRVACARGVALFDLVEPNGTERGYSWSFVPFLGRKLCLGPPRILGLASQTNTNDNLLHMPRHNNSVLVRAKCALPSTVMSASIKQDFICAFGRAIRSSRRIRRGPTQILPLPRKLFFPGCMLSVRCRQPIKYFPVGSLQCSLERVKTRPQYARHLNMPAGCP